MMKILINIVITLIITAFIIWNRLLRERLPKGLDILILNMSNSSIIVVIILILFNCLFFFISCKAIYSPNKKTTFMDKIFNFSVYKHFQNFLNIILNAPKNLYEYYSDKYNIFTKQIETSASYLVAYYNSERNQYIFLTIFIYLPRMLVATIFVLDIFYFKKFDYFYNSLILLLVPLITKIYLHMIFWQSKLMYEYSEFFLDITSVENGVILNLKRTPIRGKTIEWMIEKYDVLCNFWHIGTKLNNVHYWISIKDTKISPYITIYTSFFYIIGWLYLLLLTLQH